MSKETAYLNLVAERLNQTNGNPFIACLCQLPRDGVLVDLEILIDSSDPNYGTLAQMAALHAKAGETKDNSIRPRGFGLSCEAGFALGERSVYTKDGRDCYGAHAAKPIDGAVEIVEAPAIRTSVSSAARDRLAKLGIK